MEGDIIVKCSTTGCDGYTTSSVEMFPYFKRVNWKCGECLDEAIMKAERKIARDEFISRFKDSARKAKSTASDEELELIANSLLDEVDAVLSEEDT